MASTHALIDAVTVALPSPPLPPPLYIPSPVDRRDDVSEIEMPPHKRLCLSSLGFRYEIGESSNARPIRRRRIDYEFVSTLDVEVRRRGIGEVGYGIRDTWVDPADAVPEIAHMTLGEVNTRVTELAGLHEHDTHDLYGLLEDTQDSVCTRVLAPCTSDTATVAENFYSDTTPVMSDSKDYAVTYTSVYTDSEPGRVFWGTDEEVSEGGVPRVIVYGYDGFPIQPVPQDEDEREPRFIQAHDPDFVPEPVYPEYIPLEDEHSPGYVAESDPEEDPEYEDDEEQDDPVDYPMGEGDDGGDDDGDSSRDDVADEDEDME
nr:hypothetical protein [Tanacetum cinerariifolium]